jgi:hypothetical protein
MLIAAMASEARDVVLSIGELRINLSRHGDHHASRILLRLGIAGEIAFNMTACALDAQGHSERAHHRPNLFGFQYFQILRSGRRPTFFPFSAGRRFLREQGNDDKQSKKESHCAMLPQIPGPPRPPLHALNKTAIQLTQPHAWIFSSRR